MELMQMYATDSKSPSIGPTMFGHWSDTLRQIRAAYAEMPGLRLTLGQVQRLLALEPSPCRLVLNWLVDDGYLRLRKGFYVKATRSL
jgi:hypothetical protein